jgi:hypothetical protein
VLSRLFTRSFLIVSGIVVLAFAIIGFLGFQLTNQDGDVARANLNCPAPSVAINGQCEYDATVINNYFCPNGGTLVNDQCQYPAQETGLGVTYSCPSGGTLNSTNNTCTYNPTSTAGTLECPAGGQLFGGQCVYDGTPTTTPKCPEGGSYNATGRGLCSYRPDTYQSAGQTFQNDCRADADFAWSTEQLPPNRLCIHSPIPANVNEYCPRGGLYEPAINAGGVIVPSKCSYITPYSSSGGFGATISSSSCAQGWSEENYNPNNPRRCVRSPQPTPSSEITYTCPNGGQLFNQQCAYNAQEGAPTLTCPNGGDIVNDQCQYLATTTNNTVLICDKGGVLNGSQCFIDPQYQITSQTCPQGGVLQNGRGNTPGEAPGKVCVIARTSSLGFGNNPCTFGQNFVTSAVVIDASYIECTYSPTPSSLDFTCDKGGILRTDNSCIGVKYSPNGFGISDTCPSGWGNAGPGTCVRGAVPNDKDNNPSISKSCPAGTTLSAFANACVYNATPSTVSYDCPIGGNLSGTTCAYNASANTDLTCPSGGVLQGTVCVLPASGFTIDNSHVGLGDCDGDDVIIGDTVTCNFPLSGAPSGVPYTASSIEGSIATSTDSPVNCTINNDQITCTDMGTAGGTAGLQDVQLGINGNPAQDHGQVNLVPAAVTVDYANILDSTDCTDALEVTIGESYDCRFPLTGSANNEYLLDGTFSAATALNGNSATDLVEVSSGYSNSVCALVDNGTVDAALSCTGITTQGGSVGVRNVLVRKNTLNPVDRGDVTLTPTTITVSNIGDSTNCTSTTNVQIRTTYSCDFPLTGGEVFEIGPDGLDVRTQQGNDVSTTTDQCVVNGTTLTCSGIPTDNDIDLGAGDVAVSDDGNAFFDKGDVNIVPVAIDLSNIGDSTNCTSSLDVELGSVYSCDFPLTGGDSYALPAGGIYARTEQGSETSDSTNQCTINNDVLTCVNILTNGSLQVGGADVALSLDNTNFEDRGDVNLIPTTVDLSNIGNSTNCTSALNVPIGDTYTCEFPLTGGVVYELPNGGIVGQTLQGGNTSGTSDQCTIINDDTLECTNIPTDNGIDLGPADVGLAIDGGTPADRGDITVSFNPNGDDDNDGIPNGEECNDTGTNCPDTDQDGDPDYQDVDSDGDGIPDEIEKGVTCTDFNNCDPVDTDGDGTPDYQDLDSDNDGIPDSIERGDTCQSLDNCTPVDTDGDGTPDYQDIDSDGDGIPDSEERGDTCPTLDNCVPVDTDNDGTPDYQDTDSDGDGIPDSIERGDTCPDVDNCTPVDTDGDGTPDYQDLDSDGDGIPDQTEKGITCTDVNNCTPVDTDNDGTPDYLDLDSDGDGIPDTEERGDTCQSLDNCTPVDTDGDGDPDYQDIDADGDGIPDEIEKGDTCQTLDNCDPVDTDNDGTPDYQDLDTDGDGIPDAEERGDTCTDVNNCTPVDTDGDGNPDYQDLDSDNDTIPDANERGDTCQSLDNCTPVDTDGDGNPDFQDTDSDGDGVWDLIEGNDANQDGANDNGITPDADGRVTGFVDANGNGILDAVEGEIPALQDTDFDGTPDIQDTDDDNDNILTAGEDWNGNGDWSDDDPNGNGIPAYLDPDDNGTILPTFYPECFIYEYNRVTGEIDLDANGDPVPSRPCFLEEGFDVNDGGDYYFTPEKTNSPIYKEDIPVELFLKNDELPACQNASAIDITIRTRPVTESNNESAWQDITDTSNLAANGIATAEIPLSFRYPGIMIETATRWEFEIYLVCDETHYRAEPNYYFSTGALALVQVTGTVID